MKWNAQLALASVIFGGAVTVAAMACRRDRPDLGGNRDTITTAPKNAAAETSAALPPGELAYVTNEDSHDLTVIATANDSVVATIPVGTRPRGVKVSNDGRFVYVALSGSPKCPPSMPDEECEKLKADKSKDGIAEVDVAARKVVRVLPGGSDPEQFDMSHDGRRLYVSNEDAGQASIVEIASGKIDTSVSVGTEPEGVRVSPDGKTVYVWFESQGMYAYDFDGKLKWQASFGGINALNLGPGSSPLMFEDLVIVQSDQDDGKDSFLAGLSAKDGKVVWKTARTMTAGWSTPVLMDSNGKKEVITMASEAVIAYDPRTGKELWRGPGINAFAANTPLTTKGLVVATGFHPRKSVIAMRPDVPEEQRIAWKYDKGTAYIPSSIIYGDYLYLVADNGSLSCLDVKTGDVKYEGKRMPKPVKYTASPVAFDGKLMLSSNEGDTFVIKAGPEFEVIETNSIEEPIHASMALDGDSIFLRSDKALYRIRQQKK